MTTTTTATAPEFNDDRKARDRQFVDALLEGCSTGEAARRAGSKASSEDGLRATGSRWMKLESVQRLLLELGRDDDGPADEPEPLTELADRTLRAIIEDDDNRGTGARVKACEIVLRREERSRELRTKSHLDVELPKDAAARTALLDDALRSRLLGMPADERSEFLHGLLGDDFVALIPSQVVDPDPEPNA